MADTSSDANGWMLIDADAKDGSFVWVSDGASLRIACWFIGERFENHGSKGGGWSDKCALEGTGPGDLHFLPTHWQRVPKLPVPRADGSAKIVMTHTNIAGT